MRRVLVPFLLATGLASASTSDDPALAAIRDQAPACIAERAHCFGIQLHVAGDDQGLVVNADWVAAQLAAANKHFAALDVSFQLAGIDRLPATAVHIVTRADRNALAKHRALAKVVHVFLIGKLENVDEPDNPVFGVTWHVPDDEHKYIVISNLARDRTLAHELGHFFGLPHSEYAISIMNKTPRDEPPQDQRTFADEELAAMRPALRRIVRERILVEQPRGAAPTSPR